MTKKNINITTDSKKNTDKGIFFNPYSDFGFKKLFGEEGSKDLLIDFLNQFLPDYHQVASFRLLNTETLPDSKEGRKAFFDIFCTATNGIEFIVEMQKGKMENFRERMLFYTTFPIRKNAKRGQKYQFDLPPIYVIGIMDFEFDDGRKNYLEEIMLRNKAGQVFYEKLTYILLQMPRFNLEENQLKNKQEKWLFFLKNLQNFADLPKILNEPVFTKAKEIAKLGNLSQVDSEIYIKSQASYHDFKAVVATALKDGMKIAREEAQQKVDEANSGRTKAEQKLALAEQDKLKAEQDKLKAEQEAKNSKIEMAKIMLEFKKSIAEIIIKTQLSESEILTLQ